LAGKEIAMWIIHILSFVLGLGLVVLPLVSAIKTFILPRSAPDTITRVVFLSIRHLFLLRLRNVQTYAERDRIMAFYAPFGLLALMPTWYIMVLLGYSGMFWGLGTSSWYAALRDSGSSLLTLGFEPVNGLALSFLAFTEAMLGLLLVALLIAYLPTMYSAFSRRESLVTLLEVRAGSPPAAVEMLKRFHRIHGLDQLRPEWERWEAWFADVEESHTSLPALVFFRSPRPEHSWITAAGAVLDAASLRQAVIDLPTDPQAALCIRAGYIALRHISDYFNISYDSNPNRGDPISVSREEFDHAVDDLQKTGIPIKTDLEQAWLDFAGWRVNYDIVLLALSNLTMAPETPWLSDRRMKVSELTIWKKK
jgi:hypothetical protein